MNGPLDGMLALSASLLEWGFTQSFEIHLESQEFDRFLSDFRATIHTQFGRLPGRVDEIGFGATGPAFTVRRLRRTDGTVTED